MDISWVVIEFMTIFRGALFRIMRADNDFVIREGRFE